MVGQGRTIPSTGFAGLSSGTKETEVSLELQSVVSTLEESKRVFPVSVTEGLRLSQFCTQSPWKASVLGKLEQSVTT